MIPTVILLVLFALGAYWLQRATDPAQVCSDEWVRDQIYRRGIRRED